MTWLDEIRERVNKATPGPWAWEEYNGQENGYHIGVAVHADGNQASGQVESEKTVFDEDDEPVFVEDILWQYPIGYVEGGVVNYEDAEFIANAREDIPKLLDYIDGLHRGIEIRDNLMHWENSADENCALEESCGSCIRKWAEENSK